MFLIHAKVQLFLFGGRWNALFNCVCLFEYDISPFTSWNICNIELMNIRYLYIIHNYLLKDINSIISIDNKEKDESALQQI